MILIINHHNEVINKKLNIRNKKQENKKNYFYIDTHYFFLFHITILHLYHDLRYLKARIVSHFRTEKKEKNLPYTNLLRISFHFFSFLSLSLLECFHILHSLYCPDWFTYITHYYYNSIENRMSFIFNFYNFFSATKETIALNNILEANFILLFFLCSSFLIH